MRGRRSLWAVVLLGLALPVAAVVPKADRIADATAKANQAAARTQALQLELMLRVGDREPVGSGQLVTHPTGLARLELRNAGGLTERHLLLGNEHLASRNGRTLDAPRAFLPPLCFLQVDSPATLAQALSDFGLDLEAASLAPCGQAVCYVLGDASRMAPPWAPPVDPQEQEEGDGAEAGEEPVAGVLLDEAPLEASPLAEPVRETSSDVPQPTLWVDTRTFEIVRIEAGSGVSIEFGRAVAFGEVRFPDSITIQEPGRTTVRFDIQGVIPVNAPAAEFGQRWLLAPTGEESLPAGQP